MSRVLVVNNDDRPVPMDACWWTLRLGRGNVDEHGNVAVHRYDVPPGEDFREYSWWTATLDYFDGRNDWSWPFKTDFRMAEPRHQLAGYIQPTLLWYVSVLDLIPPHCTPDTKWMQASRPGDHYLPKHPEPPRVCGMPYVYGDWDFTPVPGMPHWFGGTTGTAHFMG